MNCHPRIYWISIWQMYLFFFFYLQFSAFVVTVPVLMFRLCLGTRTSWFGVRKRSHFCFLLLWKLSQHLVKTIWFSTVDCPDKAIQWCCNYRLIHAPFTCESRTAVMPTYFCVSFMFAWLLSSTTTRGRCSESNWSPDVQVYSAVFSSRPISSQLLCSKCLSLRLADVNILKLTTSSQNLSAKSFNIPPLLFFGCVSLKLLATLPSATTGGTALMVHIRKCGQN